MKLRILLLLLFVFGLSVSVALADPGRGPGGEDEGRTDILITIEHGASTESTSTGQSERPEEKGARCGSEKARFHRAGGALVLRGTLIGIEGTNLVVHVTKTNRRGRSYVDKDVPIATDAGTKFRRHGPAVLEDLVAGDVVKVWVHRCKSAPENTTVEASAAGDGAAAPLLARKVIAGILVQNEL